MLAAKLLLCGFAASAAAAAGGLTGAWSCLLHAKGREVPLVMEIRQTESGLEAKYGTRPDFLSNAKSISLSGDRLAFEIQLPGGQAGRFEGTLGTDTVSGEFKVDGPVPGGRFDMKRTGDLTPLVRPETKSALRPVRDEFDSPESLKRWSNFAPTRIASAEVSGGRLRIVPNSGAWWAGYRGVYYFQNVAGDFVLTTRLKVTGKQAEEPENIWTISGLLVRSATSDAPDAKENWIYVMTGRGPKTERVIDAKSTLDGINSWDITPASSGWYELRIVRMGPLFLLLCREDGGSWMLRKRILRPDLPAVVQAGVNVTSDFKTSASMPAPKYNAEAVPGNTDSITEVDFLRIEPLPERGAAWKSLAGKPLHWTRDEEILAALQ